jgi:hypothetical protein
MLLLSRFLGVGGFRDGRNIKRDKFLRLRGGVKGEPARWPLRADSARIAAFESHLQSAATVDQNEVVESCMKDSRSANGNVMLRRGARCEMNGRWTKQRSNSFVLLLLLISSPEFPLGQWSLLLPIIAVLLISALAVRTILVLLTVILLVAVKITHTGGSD